MRLPVTFKALAKVDEALEIRPPPSDARFATLKDEEADKGPVTLRFKAKVDEALEIKPPKVERPETPRVPVTSRVREG